MNFFKKFFSRFQFVPTYTENALSLSALVFFLLVVTNTSFQKDIADLVGSFLLTWLILGAGFSIFHAFSKRQKSRFEKIFMIFFIIMINFLVGFNAGEYVLGREANNFLIIFPLWNMISAILLLLLLNSGVIGPNSISATNMDTEDFIIGAILVTMFFGVSQYVFENYWAITFSICLWYAELLHPFVKKYSVIIKNGT